MNQQKDIFQFKQFEVDQSGCAMKINTDGVLLAAMLRADAPARILDIGTGTGVIALMLAQRFEKAMIDAVEIDPSASASAAGNFSRSPFDDRLLVRNVAIEDFVHDQTYDLMVSNPPYFVNDFKSFEHKKGIARHTHSRFFKDLVAKVAAMLGEEGIFWFILPVKQAGLLINEAAEYHLFPLDIVHLHSDESKPAFRYIVCLGRTKSVPKTSHFYIYKSERVYTQAYVDLLKDFFLRLE